MSDNNLFLCAARGYAARGWPVFPCKPGTKVPAIAGGCHSAFTDPEKITRTWGWDKEKHPNIAIATGELSGILVVDLDNKKPDENGHEQFSALCHELGVQPHEIDTYFVDTPTGGRHLYFEHPGFGFYIGNRTRIRPGIDLRGDGGYVVAPPSCDEQGERFYKLAPEQLAVLPLPPALLNFLKNRESSSTTPKLSTGQTKDLLVVEGQRNDYLMRVAGALRRPGLHEDALSAALIAQNHAVCSPPLPDHEVERIAQNVARYEPSSPVTPGDEKPVALSALIIKGRDLVNELFDFLGDKSKVKGLPTGLPAFDTLLGGGKRVGELTAWHAEAKTGKNSLWHKFMHMWLEQGIPIGYASREIAPATEVLPNLLSLHTQTNVWKAELTDERRALYLETLEKWPIYFAPGRGAMGIPEIKEWIVALRAHGVKHFWFDHLHFMLEDPEDHKVAAKFIRDLKVIAQETQVHVDIIIQPNRVEEGKKLNFNSMKGGSIMGQTIDNLIILERLEPQENILEVKLEMGRSKLVKRGRFYLQYNDETTDFIEVEKQKQPVFSNPILNKPPFYNMPRHTAPKTYTDFQNKFIGEGE